VPLNAFFTGAPAGLAILDVELRFVRINRRLAEMHVLSVEDHLGRPLGEVLPGLADVVEPILRQVLATGLPAVNIEIATEDPQAPRDARVWRVSAFPVGPVQEDPTGVGVVVVDITDTKRSEQQARLDGRYLSAIIESSPLSMVTLDPSSLVVSANTAFENLFLLPREEAIGRDLDELIAPPDGQEEARLLTRRSQLGEQLRLNVRRRRTDGVDLLVRVHSSPIVLDGQHVGVHVIHEHLG
jgi:PAS domain S-box-containing protein